MDILLSALDPRVDATTDADDPGFADLVARVTRRLNAPGILANPTQLDAAVIAVIQDVAQFTLAWAEPEDGVGHTANGMSVAGSQSEDAISAQRRW